MKVFKGCGLALLCFILFLLLTVFGFAFTINQVALSPGVVNGIIRDIDFADLARMTLEKDTSGQTAASLEMQNAIIDTIDSIQPVVKEKLYIAVHDTYDYLLGGSSSPNLKVVLGDSFMNPDFVEKLLAKINLSNLVEQTLNEQSSGGSDSGAALQQALLTTISKIEPDFKKQVVAASDPIFKYLLGQTSTVDVKTIARNTFLSNNFVSTVIDNVDIKSITHDMLNEQFGPMPKGINLTSDQLDRIVVLLEPAVKSGFKTAAGPVADYLVGKTSSFSVTISFQSVLPSFKPIIKEAYLGSLPTEIQGVTQAQIDAAVDVYWNDFQRTLPSTFTFTETMFSGVSLDKTFTNLEDGLTKARESIDKAVAGTEDRLSEVRVYIGYFRVAFFALIALILIIIGVIILIHRSVRGACRDLGITFLIYGALEFAGIILIRFAVPVIIKQNATDTPKFIADLLPKLMKHLTSPLLMVSIVCLIGGIVLIVVSVVYPKMKAKRIDTQPPVATS